MSLIVTIIHMFAETKSKVQCHNTYFKYTVNIIVGAVELCFVHTVYVPAVLVCIMLIIEPHDFYSLGHCFVFIEKVYESQCLYTDSCRCSLIVHSIHGWQCASLAYLK